jgi:hypothetical protein
MEVSSGVVAEAQLLLVMEPQAQRVVAHCSEAVEAEAAVSIMGLVLEVPVVRGVLIPQALVGRQQQLALTMPSVVEMGVERVLVRLAQVLAQVLRVALLVAAVVGVALVILGHLALEDWVAEAKFGFGRIR